MGTKTNVLSCVYITHSLQTRTCPNKHAHTHTYAHILPLCYVKWLKVHQIHGELSVILVLHQMGCKSWTLHVVHYLEPISVRAFSFKRRRI